MAAMSPRPDITALFTDLYEITMAQAYAAEWMSGTAVFETLFRKLPDERSYVIAAGLSDVSRSWCSSVADCTEMQRTFPVRQVTLATWRHGCYRNP
jgi:nicotinic acid phosphoribosyltransferase